MEVVFQALPLHSFASSALVEVEQMDERPKRLILVVCARPCRLRIYRGRDGRGNDESDIDADRKLMYERGMYIQQMIGGN